MYRRYWLNSTDVRLIEGGEMGIWGLTCPLNEAAEGGLEMLIREKPLFHQSWIQNILVWRWMLPSVQLQRSGPQLEPDRVVMQMTFGIRKETDNGTVEKSTTHHKGDRNIRQGPNIWTKVSTDVLPSLVLIYQSKAVTSQALTNA